MDEGLEKPPGSSGSATIPGPYWGSRLSEPESSPGAGRIVVAIYGGAKNGQNWQCGVLLSDDEGRSWRFRRVGYEPDRNLRDRPEQPVGYNEQTLFEVEDESLVSLIRGTQKLGLLIDVHPRETYYSCSVSRDGGKIWSRPELTNLPWTAWPGVGLGLPDGSLLDNNYFSGGGGGGGGGGDEGCGGDPPLLSIGLGIVLYHHVAGINPRLLIQFMILMHSCGRSPTGDRNQSFSQSTIFLECRVVVDAVYSIPQIFPFCFQIAALKIDASQNCRFLGVILYGSPYRECGNCCSEYDDQCLPGA